MDVKIYTVNDCGHCEMLKNVLNDNGVPFTEIKICRLTESHDGMPFMDYIKMEPDVSMIKKLKFPQVYFDDEYIGDMRDALHYLHENETKYSSVQKLRDNKDKLKAAKIKVQETECDLVGAKPISLTVLHALAITYSLSFIVVNDDIYYDFSYGTKSFIIDITKGNTKLLLGDQSDKVTSIKESKYYIQPSKPIKAMSSYTAKEVQDIAKKLSIEVIDESGKAYNKTMLYGLIQSKLGKLI